MTHRFRPSPTLHLQATYTVAVGNDKQWKKLAQWDTRYGLSICPVKFSTWPLHGVSIRKDGKGIGLEKVLTVPDLALFSRSYSAYETPLKGLVFPFPLFFCSYKCCCVTEQNCRLHKRTWVILHIGGAPLGEREVSSELGVSVICLRYIMKSMSYKAV